MSKNILQSQMDFSVYNDKYYFMVFHINGINCTIATIIAVYFIYFKSPSYIGQYKFFLLNITVKIFYILKFLYIFMQINQFFFQCKVSLIRFTRS